MMDLFEHAARARRSDPITSKLAAASVDVTPLEMGVIGALKAHGPLTSFEIADILRLSVITISPRMKPLAMKGLIRDSGARRIGQSGRKQTVWEMRK